MSLTRVYASLNNLIIRKLGDAGGPSSGRVDEELNRLIAWAKDAPRCIRRDFSTVGNVGTGGDDLHTFTLPAGSLATNGDYLTVDYGGQFAANNENKRVLASFDGTTYEDGLGSPQDLDGGANNAWRFFNRIIRVDSTHVRVFSLFAAQFIYMTPAGVVSAPAAAGYIQLNRDLLITTANLNSNAVIMKVVAESATATNNNIVQHMSVIELCQQ